MLFQVQHRVTRWYSVSPEETRQCASTAFAKGFPSGAFGPKQPKKGCATEKRCGRIGAPLAPSVFSGDIVIDAGNTWDPEWMTWTDLVYARDELIKFLRQIHPEDRLGIYIIGSDRFWILHEYTQNCADILQRLAAREPHYRQADVLVNTEMRSVREVAQHVVHQFHMAQAAPR